MICVVAASAATMMDTYNIIEKNQNDSNVKIHLTNENAIFHSVERKNYDQTVKLIWYECARSKIN